MTDTRDIVDVLRDFPAVDIRTAILALDPGYYCVVPDETREDAAKEIERLRAILRKCMPGSEGVDLGGGEMICLYQQQGGEK